jgi:thiol-disulfide isomerase/thioredoxin
MPSRETLWSWAKTIAFTLLIVFALRSIVRSASGPKTDSLASAFDLPAVNEAGAAGSRVSLAQLRGTPVLIEAISSWCSACERSAPALNEAARAARERPVRFVSVLLDSSPEAALTVKQRWGIEHDLLLDDGSFSRGYDISMLPTFVLIDAEGRVRSVSSGSVDRDDIEGWLSVL